MFAIPPRKAVLVKVHSPHRPSPPSAQTHAHKESPVAAVAFPGQVEESAEVLVTCTECFKKVPEKTAEYIYRDAKDPAGSGYMCWRCWRMHDVKEPAPHLGMWEKRLISKVEEYERLHGLPVMPAMAPQPKHVAVTVQPKHQPTITQFYSSTT